MDELNHEQCVIAMELISDFIRKKKSPQPLSEHCRLMVLAGVLQSYKTAIEGICGIAAQLRTLEGGHELAFVPVKIFENFREFRWGIAEQIPVLNHMLEIVGEQADNALSSCVACQKQMQAVRNN